MPTTLDPQQDRSRLIRALLEVSKLHTMQLEPDAMLDLILEHLGEVVPYNSASILLRQGESELRIVAGRGYAESPAVLDAVFDTRTIRRFHSILNNRLPVRIADVRESPDWVEIAGTEQIRAWLGVPLNSRGKIIGVLSVDRNTPNAFNEDDLKIAYTFANEVAVAIENALLSDAVEEQRNAIENAGRNESIPTEPGRPKSRILKAVLDAAPRNLLPVFGKTPGAPPRPAEAPAAPPPPLPVPPPAPVPSETPVAESPRPPTPPPSVPLPAVRVDGVPTDQQLSALEGKTRRSRYPTPKPSPSPRPLGGGLDLAGLGLVPPPSAAPSNASPAPADVATPPPSTAPAAATPAAPVDLKRETLLFGKILLSNKLVKPEALEECLRLQEKIRLMGLEVRLGQLCVDRGLIDAKTLDAVLKLQRQKFSIGGDPLALRRKGLTADTDIPIGRLAIENGLITQAQLDEAVSIQQRIRTLGVDKRLGEILVEKGYLTEDGLGSLLQVQRQRSQVLPAVPTGETTRPTTKPVSKLGLDDAAFAALDNDLLIRLLRPSGLLTRSQFAECERLRAELEASGVQKRIDEIAVQRGFATAEAIRKIVDMEFLKWRETAGKGPARSPASPAAAGAQKRRGMGVEIAAAALVILGLGLGVWYRATESSRDQGARADEMARAKADLQAMVVATKQSPKGSDQPSTVVPPSNLPEVAPSAALETPLSDEFDEGAELARAPALFPGEPARLPELRASLRNSRAGGVEFIAYGCGALAAEGTPVSLSLRFAGRQIAEASPIPLFHGGYFAGRVRAGAPGQKLLAGLYTLESSIPCSGYDAASGIQANPGLVGRGGGGEGKSRLIARVTISVGNEEDIPAERATLAALYRSATEALESSLKRIEEQIPAFGTSGDSMDDWSAFAGAAAAEVQEDLNPVRSFSAQVVAGAAPGVDAALDETARSIQDRLAVEGAALARRRHLPVPEDCAGGAGRDRSEATRRTQERLSTLKGALHEFESETPVLAAARDLSSTVQEEADQALAETSAFVHAQTSSPDGGPRKPRVEWLAGWGDRLEALTALDPGLRPEAEKVKTGLGESMQQFVALTASCGRARISEWFVSQGLPIPSTVRTKDSRPSDRIQEEREALRVRLQKLLSPTS